MLKRIALISDHASPMAAIGGVDAGGQNIAVAELATGLTQLGYSVDVFTRRCSPDQPRIAQWQPQVRVIHIDAGPCGWVPKEKLLPYMDTFANAMIQFIRRNHLTYQLLHAHFFMSGLVAMRVRESLRLPFVITFHALGLVRRLFQGANDSFPDARLTIEKQLVQQADSIVALCPQDSLDLIQLYGADPDKTTIIPNGYNPTDFFPIEQATARRHLGLAADQPTILQLGRLVPRKGIATVIQALALLKSQGINAQLLIVGGDSRQPDPHLTPEIERLRQLAISLDINEQVCFTGSRERHELRYYYGAADAFVTTPTYEPFGITPLEAMACGTPVVGSAVGGIKHTVQVNKTGFLVQPNDPATLADRLRLLLTDRALRQRLSLAAIQHVQTSYTWKQVAQQTATLYEQVTASRVHRSLRPESLFTDVHPTLLRKTA